MDSKRFEKLEKKIRTKDFEGNYKGLDKWMFIFSFVGNIGSIFFSYFLVYPGLNKAISLNLVDGILSIVIAVTFSIVFLSMFEIIKRYLIKNFSFDYFTNKNKIKASIFGWLVISFSVIFLSFYLSIIGSRNLAAIGDKKNKIAEYSITTEKDSLSIKYEAKKDVYVNDIQLLKQINIELNRQLLETPVNYVSTRKSIQNSIDKNNNEIDKNQKTIDDIDVKLNEHISNIDNSLLDEKSKNKSEDKQNIILFIIIAVFCEILIFAGVCFREYYENKLYVINQQKYGKLLLKKERYKSLLGFIYADGKLNINDKIISVSELKELVSEKTPIQNSNKFIDEFIGDTERLGIFSVVGKRRIAMVSYEDSLKIIEDMDDTLRILENIR